MCDRVSLGSGAGSTVRIAPMNSAEATNETASTATASGALMTWTRSPPVLGPIACVTNSLTSSLLLPSTSSSGDTSDGRYELWATSKKTPNVPTRNAMSDR